MNIKEVKDLIQEILQSDISDFELEHTGTKLKLRRGFGQPQVAENTPLIPAAASAAIPAAAPVRKEEPSAPPAAPPESAEESEAGLHIITSPIVGTFYQSPSPTAAPFIKIGQHVQEGSTLCIVEAMKLMNEIPSDIAGEVIRIYPDNGSPVEYGQKLFAIRPRK
jgi:acetyl-CoA carboxylase biotin carboxyl carrier protein